MRPRVGVFRSVELLPMLLVLLALGLRLFRLDFQNLRGDESFSVMFSSGPLDAIIAQLRTTEAHPPAYYSTLHFWMAVAGDSEFAVRFLSVFFDVLAVPLLYLLGKDLFGKRVGLAASAILAISPFNIWNAQDARMYTLYATLGLAATLACTRALRLGRRIDNLGSPGWRALSAYVVVATVGLYTYYYVLFLVVFHNVLALVRLGSDRPALLRWMVAQAAILVLFLPWVVWAFPGVQSYGGTGDSPGFLSMLQRLLQALSVGQTLGTDLAQPLTWGFAALLLLGSWVALRERPSSFAVAALYLAIPVLVVFAVSRVRPVFTERYLVSLAPAYFLLEGCAFARGIRPASHVLARRSWWVLSLAGVALVVVASAISIRNLYFDEAFAKSGEWASTTAFIASRFQEGDSIVLNYPDPSLAYYSRRYGRQGDIMVLPSKAPMDEEATARELVALVGQRRRVWLLPVQASSWDRSGFVEWWLDHRALKESETRFRGLRVALYGTPGGLLSDAKKVGRVDIGDQVVLVGFSTGRDQQGDAPQGAIAMRPGEPLPLKLFWQASQPVDGNYNVFVHIEDRQGRTWDQQDYVPAGWTYPTHLWRVGDLVMDNLLVPMAADAPPGEYTLVVGMYDPATERRLSFVGEAGRPPGDHVTLAAVIVGP